MATEGPYDVTVLANGIADLNAAMLDAQSTAPQIPQPIVLKCTGSGCPPTSKATVQISDGANNLSSSASVSTVVVYRFANAADAATWKNHFSTTQNVLGNKTLLE